jgi:hypothetical protein
MKGEIIQEMLRVGGGGGGRSARAHYWVTRSISFFMSHSILLADNIILLQCTKDDVSLIGIS